MNRKLDDTSCHLAMFARNRILASECRQILDRFLLLFQNYSKMNRAKNVIDEGKLVDDRNGVTANSAGID